MTNITPIITACSSVEGYRARAQSPFTVWDRIQFNYHRMGTVRTVCSIAGALFLTAACYFGGRRVFQTTASTFYRSFAVGLSGLSLFPAHKLISQFFGTPLPSFAAIMAPNGLRSLREILCNGKHCLRNPLNVTLPDFVQEGIHQVWYDGVNRAIGVRPIHANYIFGITIAEDGTIETVEKISWVDPSIYNTDYLWPAGAKSIQQALVAEEKKLCAVFAHVLEMCPRRAEAPAPWIFSVEAEKEQDPCHGSLTENLIENERIVEYTADEIFIVRRSLYKTPIFHLFSYIETVFPMYFSDTKMLPDYVPVTFISDRYDPAAPIEDGVDFGGPLQDYINSLFTGLIAHGKDKQFVPIADAGSPLIPQAWAGCDAQSGFPESLREDEIHYYMGIGRMMMCAYISHDARLAFRTNDAGESWGLHPMTIGCHFDMSLFHALQKLTTNQRKTPFHKLPIREQAQILEWLLPAEGTPSYVTNVMLPFLKGKKVDLQEVVQNVVDPSIARLARDGSIVMFKLGVLKELLLNLNEGKLAKSIAPMQAIAWGMVDFCGPLWDLGGDYSLAEVWEIKIQSIPPLEFVTRIQGSLDKNVIAAKIICSVPDDPEVSKKTQWLQEWILDEQTTNEQRIAFLKFATGASSISAKPIRVTRQGRPSPLPDVHTCAEEQLHLSPLSHAGRDDTKENFIRTLLGAMPDAGEAFLVL